MKTCPYCSKSLSGDICTTHGFVGAPVKEPGGIVPPGGIIMWSGSASTVPKGWALCDGTNGTPNLRDRFVVGAGTSYASGATGGSNADHTHGIGVSVTVNAVSMSLSHPYNYNQQTGLAEGGNLAAMFSLPNHDASHSHTASGSGWSGGSSIGTNMPAFYALAFIMRLQ